MRKCAADIIATLKDRGYHEIAEQIARQHHVPLERLVERGKEPEIVEARHALFIRLRGVLPSNSAVARLLDFDISTVHHALAEETLIVQVELARFDAVDADGNRTGEGYVFRWQRRSNPFGVVTLRATTSDVAAGTWEQQIEWFDFYPRGRQRFDDLCRAAGAGAPSFQRQAAAAAREIEVRP